MHKIEITTAQHVSIVFECASILERVLAYFIDMVLFILMLWLMYFSFLSWMSESFAEIGEFIMVFFAVAPIAIWILYHIIFEMFNKGQSPGKMLLGIKVINLEGNQITIMDSFLRAIFMVVESLLSIGVIGIVMMSSSSMRQRVGDLAANTTVVRLKNKKSFSLDQIADFQHLNDYEVTYPNIAKLTDKEILLLREVLQRFYFYPNDAHEKRMDELLSSLKIILEIDEIPKNTTTFLNTLIRDYVALTR